MKQTASAQAIAEVEHRHLLPDELPKPTDNGHRHGPLQALTLDSQNEPLQAVKSTRALAPDLLRGLLLMLMAMDHMSVALHAWRNGTGKSSEDDGYIVRDWNSPAAYMVRTVTHLCGPGFFFLLGMGVVYLGRSRSKLGWSSWRLVRHFAVRGLVLTLVAMVLGWILMLGKLWFANWVLFALAVNYFLAGVLWIGLERSEKLLSQLLARIMPSKDQNLPVCKDDGDEDEESGSLLNRRTISNAPKGSSAAMFSWHAHNFVLVILSAITIWWNIWLSETDGWCHAPTSSPIPAPSPAQSESPATTGLNNSPLRIWFWSVYTDHIESNFPPLAWLSFSILGLLYGRIMVARRWTPRNAVLGHIALSLPFALLFVLTRLFRFGNLSEGCLKTPAHEKQPDNNPYLVSGRAFFYVVKYPPEPAFWAFTMAGNLVILGLFTAIPTNIAKRMTMLLDFGMSAFFFYVVHFFVVFGIGGIFVYFFGHETGLRMPHGIHPNDTRGIDNLFVCFGIWLLSMLVMWPLCCRYRLFKSTKPSDSIWRYF